MTTSQQNARDWLTEAIGGRALVRAVLSDPRAPKSELRRVTVRPISLRKELQYQFEYRRGEQVVHRNLTAGEAAEEMARLLAETFRQALVATRSGEFHLVMHGPERASVKERGPDRPPTTDHRPPEVAQPHDRAKRYLIPEGEPCPFLARLGVMTPDGRVIAARRDKFRQVNRFLEMVADVAGELPTERPVRVVDFGSGKSYLTFALYHYLRTVRGLDARIVGLDRKREVIEECDRIAADLGYDQLSFAVGEIAGYAPAESADGDPNGVDMVVSLHACDTATDDALAQAVRWDARVILAVPCCQHELFRHVRSAPLRPLLKHGILKERTAALVTDALRAQILEVLGYRVEVIEFIETEHTPKNVLIRAVLRAGGRRERAARDYLAFRDFWHVRPHLEMLLAERLALPNARGAGAGTGIEEEDGPGSESPGE